MVVRDITFEDGFIVVTKEGGGPPTKTPIADILRAADIPVLNIASLELVSRLAKVTTVILKTLIDRKVLDESFNDGYDLDWMVGILEDELAIEDGF